MRPRDRGLRRVFVHDLEIVASVGVFEHEKRYEQRVLISVDLCGARRLRRRLRPAGRVLDYGKVMDDIVMLVQSEHVNLIETLAERIAAQCLADPRVERVRVRIEKPDVMPSCRSVGIEIERCAGAVRIRCEAAGVSRACCHTSRPKSDARLTLCADVCTWGPRPGHDADGRCQRRRGGGQRNRTAASHQAAVTAR